jgi:hypothetical protein
MRKRGIRKPLWRKSLHSQIYEPYDREINSQSDTSPDPSRRIVLITTGKIQERVKYMITRMNKRHHMPVEYLDGRQLATLLYDKGVRKRDIKHWKVLQY